MNTTMNTQTTLPEQLRLAAEIIEKKLPWEYKQCDTWLASRTSDSPVYTILSGMEIRLAQPPAPEVAHGITSAYLDAEGWCLFDAEGNLVEPWPKGWEDKLITAQFLRAQNIYIANSHPDDQDKPAPFNLAAHVQANGFRALVEGEQFHREDWTVEMLPAGTRPLLLSEKPDLHFDKVVVGFEEFTPSIDARTNAMNHTRTTRPLPYLPAPDKVKSLGEIFVDERHRQHAKYAKWDDLALIERVDYEMAAQAVRAEVSRLHAEEVETKDEVIKSLELTLRRVREHRDNAISRAESAEQRVKELESEKLMAEKAVDNVMRILPELNSSPSWEDAANNVRARISELERQLKERTTTDHLVDANKEQEPAWIEHDGGPCPLRDEEVEMWQCRLKDGSHDYTTETPPSASDWSANPEFEFKPITHYRVLKWKPGYTATTITGPKAETVPLEAKDVPPGSVIYEAGWPECTWEIVVGLEVAGLRTREGLLLWEELLKEHKINRSIPLTGRWNPDAWEPCSKTIHPID